MLPYASKNLQSTPNVMFTAAYSCRFTGCNQGYADLRTSGMRRTELLHSLTVKLTETFPALRQAAEEKKKEEKKKKGEREGERREETWPAARRSVSMTSNMLIQSLHSYMCRKNRESGGKVRERGHGRGRKMQCPDDLAFKNERILFSPPLCLS